MIVGVAHEAWYLYMLFDSWPKYVCSNSDHDTGVLVPAQQRVVPILRTCFRKVCTAVHELLMQICSCKAPSYSHVHFLHDFEVGGEEDIKVALVDLQTH